MIRQYRLLIDKAEQFNIDLASIVAKLFQDDVAAGEIKDVLYLMEHFSLKASLESVVESMGYVINKHVRKGNMSHDLLFQEVFLDWNISLAATGRQIFKKGAIY